MPSRTELAMARAAELARDKAVAKASDRLKTLRGGVGSFYPISRPDEMEVGVGVNPPYHYLIYLEDGFASFAMKSLLGKTVPILVNGELIFRKVTHVGRWRSGFRDFWYYGADGQLASRWGQRRSWTHPGVGPKDFMKEAAQEAADEMQPELDAAMRDDILERLGRL